MSVAVAQGSVMECVVAGATGEGEDIRNIFHYQLQTVTGTPTKTTLNGQLTNLRTKILAALNADYTLQKTSIRHLNDSTDAYQDFTTDAASGGKTGDALPDFAAVVIHKKSNLRGRSYRGRNHFSPIAEDDTTLRTLSTTTQFGDVATAMAATLTDSTGSTWIPVVVSRIKSRLDIATPVVVATPITSCSLNTKLGTLRHRAVVARGEPH